MPAVTLAYVVTVKYGFVKIYCVTMIPLMKGDGSAIAA